MAQGYGPDLRIFIGWMFLILGGILTGFGFAKPDVHAPLTQANVNFGWGIVLLVFGVVMLFLGYRGERAAKAEEASPTGTPAR